MTKATLGEMKARARRFQDDLGAREKRSDEMGT